ncbi:MAG: hypothetical protein KJZ75_11395 [Hyphomonadaceae bacterium]|nr:hypothetical protein [Hyphomonadaceae bacterium]
MIKQWPAEKLTALGVEWLRAHRPDALIVPEFVCGAMGAARIDLAAITKDGIFGIEVKGDGDSAVRLPSQGPLFSAVCSTVHLLPAPSLLEKMREKRPPHWAILRVEEDGSLAGEWGYRTYSEYYLAPQVLLNCLWRPELLKLCTRLRVGCDRKSARVCAMLLERQWTNWTNAQGETRRLWRPEGQAAA